MLKRFFGLVIVIPFLAKAQGIQFAKGISWEQVKQKANHENKYIFMDCAASWCLPCKNMEKEVFTLQSVGEYMNANFVSVHVQMDTSKSDDDNIRQWYKDAQALQQQYTITAFPTYLFFAPDGKIVHRHLGSMNDSVFLKVVGNSLDSNKQYYTILNAYNKGQRNYSKMPYLASMAKLIGDNRTMNKVVAAYFSYLDKQHEKELLQKKHLEFANTFSTSLRSSNKFFKIIYNNEKRVDEIMQKKHFAKGLVTSVIREEVAKPVISQSKVKKAKPDWNNLQKTILKKFNAYYGNLALLYEQLYWYSKDNRAQIKYYVKLFDDYGLDMIGWMTANNICWDIFNYSSNADTLNKAIRYMEVLNNEHTDDRNNIDTYANLLYKVGRKDEAIMWEERAKKLEEIAAAKENREIDKTYADTLDKMRKNLPTW